MKKLLQIVSLLVLSLLLTSCFTDKENVNDAKRQMWIIETDNSINNSVQDAKQEMLETGGGQPNKVDKKVVEKKPEVKKVEIKSLTEKQLLEFDSFEWENLLDWKVEITWKTLGQVDKIIVNFANETSKFPIDRYTLKQFTSGDKTFLYRAFTKYETLDFWKNVYIFEAYAWEEITKLQLILNVVKEEEKKEEITTETKTEEVQKVYQDIALDELPSTQIFWSPSSDGNWVVSYSNIDWLEIKREVISELKCDSVTSVLADRLNSWFFWNTCRPILWEEWVTFFVIRLDWDEYVYEKHYYLSYKWMYGVLELERWTWVDNQNISDKNKELKEKNDSYPIMGIADNLFKQILE